MLKVIGAGFGRTGTYSLRTALETMGFNPCFHMESLYRQRSTIAHWVDALHGRSVDWKTLFANHDAAVDFPTCLYLDELVRCFPDAKVVLTVRDPESWYESARRTILRYRPSVWRLAKTLAAAPFLGDARRLIRIMLHNRTLLERRLFEGRTGDKQFVIDVYLRHIANVRELVPPHRLLEYNIVDGWSPLCDFLEQPVPEQSFPRSNVQRDFQKFMDGLMRVRQAP